MSLSNGVMLRQDYAVTGREAKRCPLTVGTVIERHHRRGGRTFRGGVDVYLTEQTPVRAVSGRTVCPQQARIGILSR